MRPLVLLEGAPGLFNAPTTAFQAIDDSVSMQRYWLFINSPPLEITLLLQEDLLLGKMYLHMLKQLVNLFLMLGLILLD